MTVSCYGALNIVSVIIIIIIKLEVSITFLFRENRRYRTDGQTDGRGAMLNAVQ